MSLTQQLIEEIYAPLVKGDWATFFENVKDDVQWTVGNPRLKTFPVAGVYDVSPLPSAGPAGYCPRFRRFTAGRWLRAV